LSHIASERDRFRKSENVIHPDGCRGNCASDSTNQMKFEVFEPHTVDDAISLIGQNPEESRVIAGGQSLLLMIRSGLLMPRYLVSLNRISDLKQIKPGPGNKIQIGCMVTHREVLSCPMITEQANLLAQAVFRIGSTPVRNLGTLGGNVCHNEMGSDPPAALLALDATVECSSVRGRRRFPVRDLFTGYFETCLAPDEILIGTHPEHRSNWLARDIVARACGRFGLPVAHVVVDGAIDGDRINTFLPGLKKEKGEDGLLDPDAIAENYWSIFQQQRSAWTHELDVRPWVESW